MKVIITTNRDLADKLRQHKDLKARQITVEVSHNENHSLVKIEAKELNKIFWLAYHQGYADGIETEQANSES